MQSNIFIRTKLWWSDIPYENDGSLARAQLWQTIAAVSATIIWFQFIFAFSQLSSLPQYLIMGWTFGITLIGIICAWWFVRHGNELRCAQWLTGASLIGFLPAYTFIGLSHTTTNLTALIYPLICAGLSRHRPTLIIANVTIVIWFYIAYVLERSGWAYIGIVPTTSATTLIGVIVLQIIFVNVALLVNAYRKSLEQALTIAQQRTRELSVINATLEQRVIDRTATITKDAQENADITSGCVHDLHHIQTNFAVLVEQLYDTDPDDTELVETLREAITILQTSSDHLLDTMRDVAQLKAGVLAIRPAPVDIAALLQEVLKPVAFRFAQFGCQLHMIDHGQPHWIYGDALYLERVLRNVIINAHMYTTGARFNNDGIVEIRLDTCSEHTVLTVKDNGQGIAREDWSDVGTRYVSKGGKGGTGLGLPFCKGIMALHHGTFGIHSDGVGCGTMVTLTFPNTEKETTYNEQFP